MTTFRVTETYRRAGFSGNMTGSAEFSTKEAADQWAAFALAQPNVLDAEITEHPDKPRIIGMPGRRPS